MSNINQVQVIFSFLILILIVMGSIFNSFEKFLPPFLRRSLRYGKFAYGDQSALVEVPKSWFKHFYVYSSILSSLTWCLIIAVYLNQFSVPQIIIDVLNLAGGELREAHVNSASVMLAMTLLTIQCCRRFYDTHFISVFAKSGRINLSLYSLGFIHYTGAILAILIEAPKFTESVFYQRDLCWADLSYLQLFAAVVFIWSCWHQYQVTVILADLRKNVKADGEPGSLYALFETRNFGLINDLHCCNNLAPLITKITNNDISEQQCKALAGLKFECSNERVPTVGFNKKCDSNKLGLIHFN